MRPKENIGKLFATESRSKGRLSVIEELMESLHTMGVAEEGILEDAQARIAASKEREQQDN